ncbi:MAG TPA: DNA/RNA nuclease SfsA [Xanthobacteraceae bacterium]|jgi:sugar fermentation stimulation protein A
MRFPTPLIPAKLIKRYKRFLADVVMPDGSAITAHVANPGSMLGIMEPGSRVWLSKSDSLTRKLPYSWELVEVDFGSGPELVGVNTGHPNKLVAEALAAGKIAGLDGYQRIRSEVRYGKASRVDFLLERDGRPSCFLEVKNVHMMRKPGRAEFPDAVTERGAKHLDELARETKGGARSVLLFLVQIGSAESVALARDIDPAYGKAFDSARAAGVEAMALRCRISTDAIEIAGPVPVLG